MLIFNILGLFHNFYVQIYQFHDLLPAIIAIYFSARKFM